MIRQRRKVIYLLGFMGSGKSTVGKLLAAVLGWQLIDLDTVIEAGQGLSIKEIFENSGEPFFRQIEHAALTASSQAEPAVIALGGGRSSVTPNHLTNSLWNASPITAWPTTASPRRGVSRKRSSNKS